MEYFLSHHFSHLFIIIEEYLKISSDEDKKNMKNMFWDNKKLKHQKEARKLTEDVGAAMKSTVVRRLIG